MARTNFQWCEQCKCDTDQELQEADPDVGIMSAAWFCFKCETATLADEDHEP